MNKLGEYFFLLSLGLYTGNVCAAISPGIANPARAAEAISEELRNQGIDRTQQGAAVLGISGSSFDPEMLKLKFVLKRFNIIHVHENNPVLSSDNLIAPFKNKIGTEVSLGDLQVMANEMTTRYQKEGFLLTKVIIPPQHIKEGLVTFQVIEGYIDNIEISGDIDPCLKSFLMVYAQKIKCSMPLRMSVLERYTLLANDIHGLQVKFILKASIKTPGASDLILMAEQKQGNAFVSVNNFGTRYLGPVQVMAGAEVDSYFRAGDVTQIQTVSTINKQLNFIELRHVDWLNEDGLKGSVFGQYLKTIPGSILRPFEVMGNYQLASGELSYPIVRSREQNLLINTGFSVLDSQSKALSQSLYYDHIRPFFIGLFYNKQDRFKGVNQIECTLTQGLKILGASGHTHISRPHGHSVFTKFNTNLNRTQMMNDRWSVYMMLEGQYSFQPLLVPSQFGFGGSVVGRGYDPSELLGNQGLASVLELRYQCPSLSRCTEVELYTFYDAGKVWNPYYHDSATSTGVGVRAHILKSAELGFYIAKPLTHNVVAYGNRQMRAFFSITVRQP